MDAPQWNCPFIRVRVCVLLLCASLDLFGTAEHKKVLTVVRFLRPRPRPSLPAGASLSARGMYGALNPAELSLNFTEGSGELTTSRRLLRAGKLVASILFYLFIYFLLITNAKTSEAFYKLRFCLCPSTCYLV